MFAANQKLDNLVVIIDRNGLQASDRTDEIAPLGAIDDKWRAFGWNVIYADGHDFDSMNEAFEHARQAKGQPSAIIASTIKGKGVQMAENSEKWHSRVPNRGEWEEICQDLQIGMEELEQHEK